jgi:APA family basic amino acid/polyamine antiporter
MHQSAQSTLPRVIGPVMGIAIVVGTVIGSGVFKKASAVASNVNEFALVVLAWVLIGVLTLVGSLALAEVAVLLPRAGGNYVFLREGFGRWAGFLWGWVDFCVIRSASIAALASIFTESLHAVLRDLMSMETVLPYWGEQTVTVVVIVALALVNARGTTWGGGLQVLITSVKVLSLVGIAVLPFVFLAATNPNSAIDTSLLEPIWPPDISTVNWSAFGAALVGVFWAYHGWQNLGPVAEEIRNPGRNIPLALIGGMLLVTLLYVTVNIAYYLVVPRGEMIQQGRDIPVATLFAMRLLGRLGVMLASAAVMTSVFGALNGNLLVGPRLLFAMGRDRLVPHGLARLHPSYQTPAVATITLAAWSVLLVVVVALLQPGRGMFDTLTDYAMFGALSFETLVVASLFIFRRRYPPSEVDVPYRCPLYPWLPIVYVIAMSAVLGNMFISELKASLAALGLIAIGAVVYLLLFAGRPDRSEPVVDRTAGDPHVWPGSGSD